MNKLYRWILVLLLAGCGQGLPAPADPELARSSLESALDAWKQGELRESLESRTPAVYFNDVAWQADTQLIDYTIQVEAPNGQGWRCDVRQTLQRGNKSQERLASYQIDTEPAIVIVQQP